MPNLTEFGQEMSKIRT